MSEPEARRRGEEGPPQAELEPFGGEVHVRGGAAAPVLRWINYALFVWAVLYLLLHPRLGEGQVFLWTAAAILGLWALYRWLARRPPEL